MRGFWLYQATAHPTRAKIETEGKRKGYCKRKEKEIKDSKLYAIKQHLFSRMCHHVELSREMRRYLEVV